MNRSIALVVLAAFGAAGCVTHETRPQQRINATQASQEIPQEQLLDVAVHLFDENVPKDEKKLEQ
jgi:Flp pilus assembly protein CpaB